MNEVKVEPNILLLDLETFPTLIQSWGVYEVNALSIERPPIICCYSAKWLNGKQVTKGLPDYKGYNPKKFDDSKLVKDLWALLDKADIVVAQNGDNFDIKKMNTRFVTYKLTPPSPYKTVDTLKVARNAFGFDSNRLNDLGRYLNLGSKVETGGFQLWQDCMAGKKAAWKHMKEYNAYDVILLEAIYKRMIPWVRNHPNMGMFADKLVCPRCGANKLQARGFAVTTAAKYRRFQCSGCGSWGRETKKVESIKPIVNA